MYIILNINLLIIYIFVYLNEKSIVNFLHNIYIKINSITNNITYNIRKIMVKVSVAEIITNIT
jgi:hypothetical protein